MCIRDSTGGFTDFTFVDLTDSMRGTLTHYRSLQIQFDSIYSGFLGSPEQIDIVKDYIDSYRKNAKIILVDPVFADDGELYATFDPVSYTHLCRIAKWVSFDTRDCRA